MATNDNKAIVQKFVSKANLELYTTKLKTYVTNAVNAAKTAIGNYTINGKALSSNPTLSKGDVGLGNVDNVKQIPMSMKGDLNGVAELDANGKVPASQLPGYVDDIVDFEGIMQLPPTLEMGSYSGAPAGIAYVRTGAYFVARTSDNKCYGNWGGDPEENIAPPESYGTYENSRWVPVPGKLYTDTSTNKVYRWSGSALVEISSSLALGETASTAYRGDRGKIAYDHAAAKGAAFASGLYKITTNAQGHVTAAAAVVKTDITALGIPAQDTTYGLATTTQDGLMSKTDKSRVDRAVQVSDIEFMTDAEVTALFS